MLFHPLLDWGVESKAPHTHTQKLLTSHISHLGMLLHYFSRASAHLWRDFRFPITSPVYLTDKIKPMQRTSYHGMKRSKFKDMGFTILERLFLCLMICKISLAEKHFSNSSKGHNIRIIHQNFWFQCLLFISFVAIFKNVPLAPGTQFPNAGQ